MAESEKMAEAIRKGMEENPVQWGAFLAGLEAGYALGASREKQPDDR